MITDILLSAALGGAMKTYDKYKKRDKDITKAQLIACIVINTIASTGIGYLAGLIYLVEYQKHHLALGVAALCSAIALNIFLALIEMDWSEVLTRRLSGVKKDEDN